MGLGQIYGFHLCGNLGLKKINMQSKNSVMIKKKKVFFFFFLRSLDDGFQIFLTENKIFTDIQATFIQFLDNISECFRALTDTEWEEIKLRQVLIHCGGLNVGKQKVPQWFVKLCTMVREIRHSGS